MQGPFLRKYGQDATINFHLYEVDGINFRVDAVVAVGDIFIMIDEAAEVASDNAATDEGRGYSLVVPAVDMTGQRITIYVEDQTATKVWLDDVIIIETTDHPDAMHPNGVTEAGTAQAGAAQTITFRSTAVATDDYYKDQLVTITGGTGAGQTNRVLFYTGSTKVATMAKPWETNPSATSTYEVRAGTVDNGISDVGTAQAGGNSTITLATGASAVNDRYLGQLVRIVGGTGDQQSRPIISYVGATRVATISGTWATNPDSTSLYEIYTDAISEVSLPSAPEVADAVWDEDLSSGHVVANSAAVRLSDVLVDTADMQPKLGAPVSSIAADIATAQTDLDIITGGNGAILATTAITAARSVASGTADSGSTTTMVDAARTEIDNEYWNGASLLFTSGDNAGLTRTITGFNAGTNVITFSPALINPILVDDAYEILPVSTGDLSTDIADISGRLPATLTVGGRVRSAVEVVNSRLVTGTGVVPTGTEWGDGGAEV
jgi:hypothetical protein